MNATQVNEVELGKEVVELESGANALIVDTKESFEYAGEIVLDIDAMIKKVETYWKELKRKAHEAHKAITAKESEMLGPLKDKRKTLRSKISVYLTIQEKIRQEEQKKIDAERRQQEAELKQKQEEAAKIAEKNEEPEPVVLETYVPPVIVQPEVLKTTRMNTGTISQKKDITVEVVDISLLLNEIVKGNVPSSIIEIKEAKLKSFIKMQELKELSGCKIDEVIGASFRGRL